MGQLLRTKRHTATGKQIQVLVAAVNRHMPATPAFGNQLRIKDAYFNWQVIGGDHNRADRHARWCARSMMG
jgi:hypothetical protein